MPHSSYKPQTLQAMAESEQIMMHPNKYKSYQNGEEMMSDILKDVEDA